MHHDQIFRLALIGILTVTIPILVRYRVKSQATHERLDRQQEGLFILATLRPVGLAFWLGLIAWMLDPGWMTWASMPLPVWVRWAGVGLAATAGVLVGWTFQTLGPNLTDTVVTRRAHTLILHGPYRWIRHPFYGSAALFLVSIALITASWFLLLAGVLVFCLLVIRTRIEEENLVARFGDGYRRYMARTGRFLPRIRANRRDV